MGYQLVKTGSLWVDLPTKKRWWRLVDYTMYIQLKSLSIKEKLTINRKSRDSTTRVKGSKRVAVSKPWFISCHRIPIELLCIAQWGNSVQPLKG